MLIYSGYTNVSYGTMNYNNGWQDWGWVPHYVTNNPSFNGTNSVVFAASSGYQAWHLEHDPIDTTVYTNLTLWLNGGGQGGQTVGVQAEAGSSGQNTIYVKAPTNVWQQFTFSLASLGVGNITNLSGFEIWNGSTAQSNFYIAAITLTAAPAPATVHVGVNALAPVRTVDSRVFSINTAAWDGYLDTAGTVSILTNMNNQALRWPGGSWGDIYFMTNETDEHENHQFHPRGHQHPRASLFHRQLRQRQHESGGRLGEVLQYHQSLLRQILGGGQ